jgi:pimeloyl-ACP methyl ester carboxylesterase
MQKPRVLLVPEFTELEWTIRDQLDEWAETASYDPPGVGDEPITPAQIEGVRDGTIRARDLFVERGIAEVDRRGWDRFFVVADGWGTATAARIAVVRRDAVRGVALGHASVSYAMDGDRPVVNRQVYEAMGQFLAQGHREFIRHGIVQMTQSSVDEELAGRMIDRFPGQGEWLQLTWDALAAEEPIGDELREYGGPLLLAQHVGCLTFSDEGYRDAVAAFPDADTLRVKIAPGVSPEFAEALRDFCRRHG